MKIVLLPGMDGTGVMFQPLIKSLHDFECLCIALPEHCPQDYSTLVQALIPQLPEEPFILLGESFSGALATYIALTHPHNLQGLILVGAFLSPPNSWLLQLAKFMPDASWAHPTSFSLTLAGCNAATVPLAKQAVKRVPGKVMRARINTMAQLSPPTEQCQYPTVIIRPQQDRLVYKSCLHKMVNTFRHLHLLQPPGTHFYLQNDPKQAATVLKHAVALIQQSLVRRQE